MKKVIKHEYKSIIIQSDQPSENVTYYYHPTYNSLLTDIFALNNTYSEIVDVFSLNNRYDINKTVGEREIWAICITNESTRFQKPEVLFIGTHHGNERISTETGYWLAFWFAKNYYLNSWIQYLVDHREIYIIPLLNPDGHEMSQRFNGNGVDLNRNYDYDWSQSILSEPGTGPFSELETQCIREFVAEHQFINGMSWHSGAHGIYYPWSDYIHETGAYDPSPDDKLFNQQGRLMSREGGNYSEGYYEYGIGNDLFGPIHASWGDWAYAAGELNGKPYTQDPDGYVGTGILTYEVEISTFGTPKEETLGGEGIPGWIPKNIRLALVLIDLAEPYVMWDLENTLPYVQFPNGTKIYTTTPGSRLFFSWVVNGSIEVDETRLYWGSDPDPINKSEFEEQIQNGYASWDGGLYSQLITLPETGGSYYFTARAQVDSFANDSGAYQSSFSRYVKQRNWVKWSETIKNQIIIGQRDWYSSILRIQATTEMPSCEILSPTFGMVIGGEFPIKINIVGIEKSNMNNVTVSIDNYPYVIVECSQEEGVWIYNWDTKPISKGTHTIRAMFTTKNGIIGISSKLQVIVDNISDTTETESSTTEITIPFSDSKAGWNNYIFLILVWLSLEILIQYKRRVKM
ncbi:MAG: M14 family zinc carboxypeptidase [Candidatus Hodarchaeota archaeon]